MKFAATSTAMKPRLLPFAVFSAALVSGCISIPMGTEVFTSAEFPTEIRPSEASPIKRYEPSLVVEEGDSDNHRTLLVGLSGTIVSEQAQEQHYASVTVEKRKRLAFGIGPAGAESSITREMLEPMAGRAYLGKATYSPAGDLGGPLEGFGGFLSLFLSIPYAVLWEPFFGTYECGSHHWIGPNLEYLSKFSEEERRKIGVWTFADQSSHPQKGLQSWFTHAAIIGFHRCCEYTIRNPEPSSRTTPAEPRITASTRAVPGPFKIKLELPSSGFSRMGVLQAGELRAVIDLDGAATGEPVAEGLFRILPPTGGWKAVPDLDNRALLKAAAERPIPVSITLPAPGVGLPDLP